MATIGNTACEWPVSQLQLAVCAVCIGHTRSTCSHVCPRKMTQSPPSITPFSKFGVGWHAAVDAVLNCVQATPSADTAMFFFQTNHLHFSAEFLGRVRLVGSIASLAGVGTYNYLLKDVPLTKMFFWTAVLGTGLGLTQLILITGMADPLTTDCAHLTFRGGTHKHDDKEMNLSS